MTFKTISELMIIHLVTNGIFWINFFPPSKPGTGLYNTKGPGQLVIVTVVDYNKAFHLHPGKYVQVHQEYEPWNTIHIYQTDG